MHVLVVLFVVLLIPSLAQSGLPSVSIYRSDQQDCNFLNSDAGLDYTGSDGGLYPVKVIGGLQRNLQVTNTTIANPTPFSFTSDLSLRGNVLVMKDVNKNNYDILRIITFGQANSVGYNGEIYNFSQLFLYSDQSEYLDLFTPPIYSLSNILSASSSLYSLDFSYDVRSIQATSSSPSQISMDGSTMTWLEKIQLKDPNTNFTYHLNKILAYDLNNNIFLSNLSINDNIIPETPSTCTIRSHPRVWQNIILYQEFNPTTNSSSVWIYNKILNSKEPLHPLASSSSYFSPSLSESFRIFETPDQRKPFYYYSSYHDVEDLSNSSYALVTWIESKNQAVNLVNDEILPFGNSAYFYKALTVHIMVLPVNLYFFVTPSSWLSTTTAGAGGTGAIFNELVHVLGSDSIVFFVVRESSPSNGRNSPQYKIRVLNIESLSSSGRNSNVTANKLYDLTNSIFDSPITLLLANEKGLSFSVDGVIYFSKIVNDNSFDYHMITCQVTPAEGFSNTAVTFSKDIFIFTDNNGNLNIMDMNKDKDSLIDANDRFPLDNTGFWDSDNDYIPDGSDMLNATGKCLYINAPGACTSDTTYFYVYWLVYAIIMGLVIMIPTSYHWKTNLVPYYQSIKDQLEEESNRRKLKNKANNTASNRRKSSTMIQFASLGQSTVNLKPSSFTWKPRGSSTKDDASSSNFVSGLERDRQSVSYFRASKAQVPIIRTSAPPSLEKGKLKVVTAKLKRSMNRALGNEETTNTGDVDDDDMDEESIFDMDTLLAMGEIVSELFVLSCTVVSLSVAMIPYLNFIPLSSREQVLYEWIDFYITYIFVLDIIARYIIRNRHKVPDFKTFFITNLYDFPACFVEIPGTNNSIGNINSFLILTKIGRFMRIFRIFKVFRLVRLYKRLSQADTMVNMMVYNPSSFIMFFLVFFIFICTLILMMLAQHSSYAFADFPSVLWFTIVTVTTIGYGDIVPTIFSSRFVMTFILLIGMGMIGTVSSNIAGSLMTIGKTDEKLKKVKVDNQERYESFKLVFNKCQLAMNPLVACIPPIFLQSSIKVSSPDYVMKRGLASPKALPKKQARSEASFIAEVKVKESMENEVDDLLEKAAHTPADKLNFIPKRRGSQLSINQFKVEADIDKENYDAEVRELHEMSSIDQFVLNYQDFEYVKPLSPFWLSKIDSGSSNHKSDAWTLFSDLLETKHQGKNSLFIEKLVTSEDYISKSTTEKKIGEGVKGATMKAKLKDGMLKVHHATSVMNNNNVANALLMKVEEEKLNLKNKKAVVSKINLMDPLDAKISKVESILKKHGAEDLVEHKHILNELVILILLNERRDTSLWSMYNLKIKDKKYFNEKAKTTMLRDTSARQGKHDPNKVNFKKIKTQTRRFNL